jgi:hypothetical protein
MEFDIDALKTQWALRNFKQDLSKIAGPEPAGVDYYSHTSKHQHGGRS